MFAFANLPWDFVYLWVTQSRNTRVSVPIIPRTVNVTYEGQMSNDTSVFPVAPLENPVTVRLHIKAKKYAVHLGDEALRRPFPNELFVFDL